MVTIYWQGHANAITSYDAILFKNSTFRRKLQYDSILFCTRCRNPIIGNNTKKQGKNHKLFPCFFFAPCRPGQPHRSHCVPMNIIRSDFGRFLLISAIFGTDAVLRIFADHIKYHRQKRSSRHGIGNSAFLLCVIHAGAWGCCLWAAISAFIWTISSASFCSHSFSLWA